MNIIELLKAEFGYETANTRRMLEALPENHFDWKPHPKSMHLGQLAAHIAELPDWLTLMLTTNEADFAAMGYQFPEQTDRNALLERFDQSVRTTQAKFEAVTLEELGQPWTLRSGETMIFTVSRLEAIRDSVLNHLIHHRGQLSVYLRLLESPVPGMYGASADEAAQF